MSGNGNTAPATAMEKNLARLQATAVDAVLLGITILMVEFLVLAFSGQRGPTGLLLSAEQILDLLHYGWAAAGGIALAVLWNLFYHQLGASPDHLVGVGQDLWPHTTPARTAPLSRRRVLHRERLPACGVHRPRER